MRTNLLSFLTFFLRLLPFFLVCYFLLLSMFSQDFKGIIYLVGLIFTIFTVIILGNALPISKPLDINGITNKDLCNFITFNNVGEISRLPLGQAVLGYTFSYLLVSILKYNYVKQNITTIVLFPLLILFDMAWDVKNSCHTIWQAGVALFISLLLGLLWGVIINSTNNKNLVFLTGINNKETCVTPANRSFLCKKKKS